MNKIIIVLFLSLSLFHLNSIDSPTDPTDPGLTDKFDENSSQSDVNFNIQFQNQKGEFGKGVIKSLKGIYLNLIWDGNEIGSQEILMDFVKAIRVKGYTTVKKERDNLAVIYYFPHLFDIELKDGNIIKNARGRIKELDNFTVYNSIGRRKCYTYFIRYWLKDKNMFYDNSSTDIDETPKVPDSVIIYMEFE